MRLGFRLARQATGPREAVLEDSRIHGGIKARENKVEEAIRVLGKVLPSLGSPENRDESPHEWLRPRDDEGVLS